MFLWIIAVIIAYFVKGMTGFANTLVVTSILAYSEDNAKITPVELLLTYPANLIMAWRYRKQADWHVWLPLGLMVVAGGIPGMLLLKNLDTHLLKILFGFVVVLMGLNMLRTGGSAKPMPRTVDLAVSLAAGIMCGLFGVGAMLAAYLGRTVFDNKAYKGNLAYIFMLENTMRIVFYSIFGLIGAATLRQFLYMLPFMGLGLFLGMKSSSVIRADTARRVVIIMLIISGVALVVTNLV